MTLDQIETGDLIAVRTAHSFTGTATQFFTRSPYTHAGIAFWHGGELFLAELNGGRNHLVPFSQLDDFDVYARPEGITAAQADAAVRVWLAKPINYGVAAFIMIGILDYFKIEKFVHWQAVMVCSGFCVAIYEEAGWPEHTRVLSPGDLAKLLTLKGEFRPLTGLHVSQR